MRLFYPLLLVFLPFLSIAQYQIRSATLIDTQQQTTTGSIRFYDRERHSATVEFIPQGAANVKTIPVSTVHQLRIENGPTYRGLTLAVPYYKTEALSPGDEMVDHTDTIRVLAEQLLDSPLVQLYRFADKKVKTRYALVKHDSVFLLHNIDIQLIQNGTVYSYTESAFRRELRAILNECPTLNTDRTQYTEKSLTALLSDYLRFCRVTPTKQVIEQTVAKSIVDIGASGYFLARVDEFRVSTYVATIQMLLPKRFHNLFVMLDAGRVQYNWEPFTYSEFMLGLFAGKYIGRGAFQGKVYTGVTTATGFLDTGVGVSYRKLISIEGRYPITSLSINGFRTPMSPFLAVRAMIPLSGANRVQTRRK